MEQPRYDHFPAFTFNALQISREAFVPNDVSRRKVKDARRLFRHLESFPASISDLSEMDNPKKSLMMQSFCIADIYIAYIMYCIHNCNIAVTHQVSVFHRGGNFVFPEMFDSSELTARKCVPPRFGQTGIHMPPSWCIATP